ncbi:MAG: cobalamin-binding protein [Euryarchaeota archaeon]|nr:cobalamin-binding protein [Euryarchaeota archaeon]
MRIASLLPSATEIVHSLGMGTMLVGRSHECDHPPQVQRLPVLSTSAVDAGSLASPEIHREVAEKLRSGRGLYRVDIGLLEKARPDLILTQETCEVCAPVPGTLEEAIRGLPSKPRVVSLRATSLEGIYEDIMRVADAANVWERGVGLVKQLKARIERTQRILRRARGPTSIACIEWLDPLYAAGHWVPEMAAIAGGRDLFGAPGAPSRPISWEEVREAKPEVIALMPCGFRTPRALREAPLVTGRPGFHDLPAAHHGRVWALDGSSYFNRPGPRVVEGIEILAELLHPELVRGLIPPGGAEKLQRHILA